MKPKLLLLALLVSQPALSAGFTAVCDPDETHAYRNSLDIAGEPIAAEWTSDEEFYSKWTFVFNGEDELLLDGKAIQILHWDGVSLMAIDNSSSSEIASAWLYAFNLDLKDVVGSQANSYQFPGSGVKTRSTNFNCDFDSHAN